jgi:hypothetical protein
LPFSGCCQLLFVLLLLLLLILFLLLLLQALPVAVRKGGGKAGDALAPLLQLPGVDQETLKKLRKRKINSLAGDSSM